MNINGPAMPPLNATARASEKATPGGETEVLDFLACLNRLLDTDARQTGPTDDESTTIKLSTRTRIGDSSDTFEARPLISPVSEDLGVVDRGLVNTRRVVAQPDMSAAQPDTITDHGTVFADVLAALATLLSQSPAPSRAISDATAPAVRSAATAAPPIASHGMHSADRPAAAMLALESGKSIEPANASKRITASTSRAPSDFQRLLWVAPGPDGLHLNLRLNRFDKADRAALENTIERLFRSYGHRLSGISYVGNQQS